MIDYKTQQSRLFPLLASAYAFRFVGEWLLWLYTDVTERLKANDFSTLPEAHACTAGLKSLTTTATAVCYYFCISLLIDLRLTSLIKLIIKPLYIALKIWFYLGIFPIFICFVVLTGESMSDIDRSSSFYFSPHVEIYFSLIALVYPLYI